MSNRSLNQTQGRDVSSLPESPLATAFSQDGFIGPIDLLTRAQCQLILKHYRRGVPSSRAGGWKDLAARDRFFYELAKRPTLVEPLRLLLGEDIVLWGASIVERTPGETHTWHTDIETSAPGGRFVTVWVGLENTCRESALQLISRSHLFGRPIQQEIYDFGLRRGEVTDDMVTAWAQAHDLLSDFVQPKMSDGQALLFDGGLWHASRNAGRQTRAALLLQYAAAGTPILTPDFDRLEWPFRFTSTEQPTVVVSGNGKNGNAHPPSACAPGAGPITTEVHSGGCFEEGPNSWTSYDLFQGPSPLLTEMESHVSVLSPGSTPHPTHCHVQEELLIVLRGEAEAVIGESPDPNRARIERLGPGSFVYYPAYQYHTIRNASTEPVTYLMYKWQAALADVDEPMQTEVFDASRASQPSECSPMSMSVLFEKPTVFLDGLHAHVTDLAVGASYPDHIDEYDVAIVILAGSVETLGKTLGPGGSVFYAAGEMHGMRNVGDEPARYLVFEFHRIVPPNTIFHAKRRARPRRSRATRLPTTDHAILVFGHTRPEALQLVLEGLCRQDALAETQVWLDGHQEDPQLVPFVKACQDLESTYPEAQWHKYGSRCGFSKIFIDAVLSNCSQFKKLIVLQDDCYPAPSAIDAFLSSLEEIENNPDVFSVYGHHFGTLDEGSETSAFQCWGWASSSEKLQPIVTEFSRLWTMPESRALDWFKKNMTAEIRARMDVFPGRSESKLLDRRLCFDAAMAFLIARNGMSNRKTPKHVIHNFGIGERSWHFPTVLDFYLKPPFNMTTKDNLIEHFGLQELPDDHDLMVRYGTSDGRLDVEVKTLRASLAASEQDRADRLEVINRLYKDCAERLELINRLDKNCAERLEVINGLKAKVKTSSESDTKRRELIKRLRGQIEAQKHPWVTLRRKLQKHLSS